MCMRSTLVLCEYLLLLPTLCYVCSGRGGRDGATHPVQQPTRAHVQVMPSGPQAESLAREVEQLRVEVPGAPRITPHTTVLAKVSLGRPTLHDGSDG